MALNCVVGEDSWEFLGLQGDQTSQSQRKSILNIHWKDWCWSWSSNTSATWCKEPTHWKTPWCWERLKEGKEGDNRRWAGWMASPTQWHEFVQSLGDSEGQRSLACYSPWGGRVGQDLATTQWQHCRWLWRIIFSLFNVFFHCFSNEHGLTAKSVSSILLIYLRLSSGSGSLGFYEPPECLDPAWNIVTLP